MCLLIFKEENKKPITLTKDLVVYKLLGEGMKAPMHMYYYIPNHRHSTNFSFNETFRFADNVVRNYMREKYPSVFEIHNLIYRTYYEIGYQANELKNALKKEVLSVCQGFHSASSIKRLIDCRYDYYNTYQAVIPKGSTIYKDETGLIVSNHIVIISMLLSNNFYL